jgi:hypothetical protein
MSYVILRGHCCHFIDGVKDIFDKELKRVFDKFPKYHMEILLDFNAKVGREDTFKPTIRNESMV